MSRLPGPAPAAISFQYLAEIAVGATTRVDLCRAVGPHRPGELLAVKRLHPHLVEDSAVATQFLDEVWVTSALKHPNVVEVAGWGEDEQGPYLAVELVQGVSLARLMKTVFETGEIFSERLVVYIAGQVCRGLAAAHVLRSPQGELLNLVHRDLTPSNVLIGFSGEVKIADFGLAKAKMRMTKTLTGMLKGQPSYMSPEQARGMELDRRSDLFSLGVLLFELFTGRHPWPAATEYEVINLAATEPPPDLRELRPKIDKELVSIVMRCLEKNPATRFQSADEVLARLDEWLHAHGYMEGSAEALARFVRRNAMRQMRWFERAVMGAAAPDSLRAGGPRTPAPPPPRVPTYTNSGAGPISLVGPRPGPADVRRGRGQRRQPGREEEITDVTDVESKVAALHARNPPVIREIGRQGPFDEESSADDKPTGEWGEEVPTMVKRGAKAAQALRPADPPSSARQRTRQLPRYDAMADEDSDLRTTSVNGPLRARLAAAAGAPAPGPAPPGRGAAARTPLPSELESEEVPTMPINKASAASAAAVGMPGRPPSVAPGVVVSPSAGVPPVPRAPGRPASSAPPPPGFRSPPQRPPPMAQGAPPAPSFDNRGSGPGQAGPSPRAQFDDRGFRSGQAGPSPRAQFDDRGFGSGQAGPSPRAQFDDRASPRGSAAQALRAVASPEPQRREEASPYSSASTRAATEERLLAEADRLALEAVRLREDAKVAAAQAERKAAMARTAGHAAALAAEAVRVSASAGMVEATRRLDEALALEQSVHRAAATPLSLPEPDARLQMTPGYDAGFLGRGAGQGGGPPRTPVPTLALPQGSLPVPGGGRTPAGPIPAFSSSAAPSPPEPPSTSRLGAAPVRAQEPSVQPSYLRTRNDAGAPPSGMPPGVPSAFDAVPGSSGRAPPFAPAPDPGIAPMGPGVITNLDALTFRSRLQPMVLGMPRFLAVMVAVTAFIVVLAGLWFFFS